MTPSKPPPPGGGKANQAAHTQRLAAVGSGVSDAVLLIDDEHVVLWGNEAAHEIFQGGPRGVAGRRCWEVIHSRRRACDRTAEECPIDTVRISGVAESCQKALEDADGKRAPSIVSAQPVLDPQGNILEYVLTRRDPRARNDVWRIVQEQSDDLALVHTLTQMANRGCPQEELLEELSRSVRAIFGGTSGTIYLLDARRERLILQSMGMPPKLKAGIERIIGAPMPEVRIPLERAPRMMAALHAPAATVVNNRAAILELMAEHTEGALTRRVLGPILRLLDNKSVLLYPLRRKGEVIGLMTTGRSTAYTKAEVLRLGSLAEQVAGIVVHRKLQDDQRRLTKRQSILLQAVTDGILGVNNDGQVVFANTGAEALLGHTAGTLQGQSIHQLCGTTSPDGKSCDGEQCDICSAIRTRRSKYEADGRLRRLDGSSFPVRFSAVPTDESEVGIVVTFRDVSERLRLQEAERHSTERIRRSFAGTVAALSRLAEMRDPYTAGHERRVATLARAIAQRLDLDEERVDQVRLAATIHDIGKHAIPVEILTKPSRLSRQEFDLIRTHPVIGWEILTEADFPGEIATVVRQHHERLDGTGYPDGITSDAILFEARILAVADVVEAMASHRPYRASKGLEEALMEIQRHRGVRYDSDVVSACVRVFRSDGFSWD